MAYFPSHYFTDGLTFSSLKQDLKTYSFRSLFADMKAGFAVAFVTLPMAMAYALLAGLPLTTGLYTAIFSAILASLFGSCRQMIIGPSNAIAILTLVAISTLMYNNYRDVTGPERETLALSLLAQLTFLVGFFHAVASFFKLGRLTQFVSHSVVVGYLAGVAFALVISQLFPFFGTAQPAKSVTVFQSIGYFFQHIDETHLPTLGIGLVSLLLMILLSRSKRQLPAAALVVVFAGLSVNFLGSDFATDNFFGPLEGFGGISVVGDRGSLNDFFPVLHLPYLDLSILNELIPFAFAIALLSSLETTLVAKSITASTGQPHSIDQELFGLSLANLVSSFIFALPSSGSITRSHMLLREGGRTHFSGVFSALSVAILVVIFGYFVERIPLAALSAILIYTSVRIINWHHLRLCLKATRADATVMLMTFLFCIFVGLDVAFYAGVTISITLYLRKAAIPYFVECVFDDSGTIGRTHRASHDGVGQIRVINVQGELFFGAADLFQNSLKSITRHDEDLRVVILRLKNARDIDATACLALQQLNQYLKETGRHLILCGLTYPTWEVLSHSGTLDEIGKENLFIIEEKAPKATLQKALRRAKQLAALSNVEEESPEEVPETPTEEALVEA